DLARWTLPSIPVHAHDRLRDGRATRLISPLTRSIPCVVEGGGRIKSAGQRRPPRWSPRGPRSCPKPRQASIARRAKRQRGRMAMTEEEALRTLRGDDAAAAARAADALWGMWHRAGDARLDGMLRAGTQPLAW